MSNYKTFTIEEKQQMKNLYTYKEIKDKLETSDYSAAMLLMHLLLRYEELDLKYAKKIGEFEALEKSFGSLSKVHVDTIYDLRKLYKQRDEARGEAETVRALYEDATGVTGTFTWEKDGE